MTCQLQPSSNKRRMSYWEKMIADEDIPREDLHSLSASFWYNHDYVKMFNQIPPSNHLHSPFSDFESEAYNEYKSRVFAQLASEYEKEKTEETKSSKNENDNSNLHSENVKNSDNALWNDTTSDSIASVTNNHTLPHQKQRTNTPCRPTSLHCDKASKSESDLYNDNLDKPLMDWSSFEEQIKLISEKMETSNSSPSNNSDSFRPTTRQWKGRKSLQNKHRIEIEAVRHKLSHGNSQFKDESNHFHPSANRLERSFSNGQQLQVCYFNASCSSSDSDSPPTTPMLTSPSFSPRVLRPLNRGRSSSSSPYASEHTIISFHNHKDRSKLDELELEARYQLARAHQRVKAKVKEERNDHEDNSLAQKVLYGVLPEEISTKVKSYCLKKEDCRKMTLGQLRLLINDMNRKKIVLNDDLVALLIVRDELRTENDAKLVDIADIRSMIKAAGPETTI